MAITRDEFLNAAYPTEFWETLPEIEKKWEREFIKKTGFMRMLMNNGRFSGNHTGYKGRWDIEEDELGELKTWSHNTALVATDEDNLTVLEMPWSPYYDAMHFSELDKLANRGKSAIRSSMERKRKRRRTSYNQQLANELWNGDGSEIGSGYRKLQGVRTFMKSTGTAGLSYPAGDNGASLDNTVGHTPIIIDGDAGDNTDFATDATERLMLAINQSTRTTDDGECMPDHGFISRTSMHTLTKHVIDSSTFYLNVQKTDTSDRFKFGFNGGFEFGGVPIEYDEQINDKEIFLFASDTWDLESHYDKVVKFFPRGNEENVGDDEIEVFKSVLRLKCRKLGCQALVHWA